MPVSLSKGLLSRFARPGRTIEVPTMDDLSGAGSAPAWGPFVVCQNAVATVVHPDSEASPTGWDVFAYPGSGMISPISFQSPAEGIPVWINAYAVDLTSPGEKFHAWTAGAVTLTPGDNVPYSEFDGDNGVDIGVSLVETGGVLAISVPAGTWLVGINAQVPS